MREGRDSSGVMFKGRSLSYLDYLAATALGLAFVILVMNTTSMGFTRDESFYFHHGKVYFNWLFELHNADSQAERSELLGRDKVEKVWKNNSEHPPLMKVLFGVSWRLFGEKRRPIRVVGEKIEVRDLGIAHGFDEGDVVTLLAPISVGGDPADAVRHIGKVKILSRQKHQALGELLTGDGTVEDLKHRCDVGEFDSEGNRVLRGCEVETDEATQFLSESDAFRFPGALFGGLLVFLVFLFGVEWGGTAIALLATLLTAFVPRLFFHAHLTCFDIPITALNFLVLVAFARSLNSTIWAVWTAVFWGFALLTKLNAFFIPITLILWWVVANWGQFRRDGWKLSLPALPAAFLFMPLIGLPMLFLLWPWLWYDSIAHMGSYMGFHLKHEHYFQYYFGQAYQAPPFPVSFPFAMTLFTMPVMTLILFFVGTVIAIRESIVRVVADFKIRRAARGNPFRESVIPIPLGSSVEDHVNPELTATMELPPEEEGGLDHSWGRVVFVVWNLAFPILLIAQSKTPIFGGVKHWLLSVPFMAFIAAWGLQRWIGTAAGLVRTQRLQRIAAMALWVIVGGAVLAPGARDTLKYVSHGTAYYNEFIGGARGASDERMQRQFWSYANRDALDYVNRYAPYKSQVDFQDATNGTCGMYEREGWMREDLKCVSRRHAPEVMLFDVEERFTEEEMRYWKNMDTLGPIDEATVDGVPLVRIYRKDAGFEEAKRFYSLPEEPNNDEETEEPNGVP